MKAIFSLDNKWITRSPIYTYSSRNLVDPAIKGWNDNALDMHASRWVTLPE